MADSDDDWETDADFENNLTEAEQRAFGNKETMDKYNAVMDKAGASVPGQSVAGVTHDYPVSSQPPPQAPPPPPPPAPPQAAPPPPPPAAPPATPPIASPVAPAPVASAAVPPPPPPAAPTATSQPTQQPTPGKLDRSAFEMGGTARSTPVKPQPHAVAQGQPTRGIGSHKNVLSRARQVSMSGGQELKDVFDSFDSNKSGSIDVDELSQAMTKLSMPMARDKLVAMLQAVDSDGNGEIDFKEFVQMVERVKAQKGNALAQQFSEAVNKKGALMQMRKEGGVVHSFAEDECAAFVDFINSKLSFDANLKYLLPMTELDELFTSCSDGVLLCRLINLAVEETIDERTINYQPHNRFLINENLNLAISAAKSVGVHVVNIGAGDLMEGRPHLVLGLVWQLVKMCLLSKINLKENPNLIHMLEEGETLEFLLKLPPEKLLMRWFNHQLAKAGVDKKVSNFGADLKDSELYVHLLQQIDPEKKCDSRILANSDLTARAGYVASQGSRLNLEFALQPADIVSGNEKLNMAFVAALFNACPALDPPKEEEIAALMEELPDEDEGDSREERAFRMWINSLGMDACPHVASLYDDVRDGLVILYTMDKIRPGVVDWDGRPVNRKNLHMVFKRVENCNYAVELALSPFKFSLVGVQGKDIQDGNKKLTLALFWQLMRYHLFAFLAGLRSARAGGAALSDAEMIAWACDKVKASGASSTMKDFHDKSLANGLFLIDLLAAIEPRCIDRKLVTAGSTDEEKKLNAKYVISSARKINCELFLVWEDIVDVRPKMILSFVASVMSHAMAGGAH